MVTQKRLKIAFLTANDATNKNERSGTLYYMSKALQKHCGDVFYIGPLSTRMESFTRLLNNISLKLFKKNYAYFNNILLSYSYSKIIKHKLSEEEYDLIFAPVASAELAFLDTDIPIIYTSDATFHLMSEYYPDQFSNLLSISKKEGNFIENTVIKKADLILYPSEWAAKSAVKHYEGDESKIYKLPFGANLDKIPSKEVVLEKEKPDKCRLLFLGMDWKRKGGDIAFATLLELEKLNIDTELIICGCTPPEEFSHENMIVIPFLDKNDENQSKELEKLFLSCDFLLLPTRNEAYGIVFCEANAFGLPVITTNTGGVSGVIDPGRNGFMLPEDAVGADYAKVIQEFYDDDERYIELARSSRETFDEKLNWDSWARNVCKLINEMLDKR